MAYKDNPNSSCLGEIKMDFECQHCDCLLGGLIAPAESDTECELLHDLRQKSHNFYFELLDDLPLPMWHSNTHQKYVFFNKAWLALTGKRLEEQIVDRWLGGVHQEDILQCQETMSQAYGKHTAFEREYRLLSNDGTYRWIAETSRPCLDINGNFAGYIGTCYDITEHKEAEEEVLGLTQFQETVIDNANVWLDVVDNQKRVLIWNKAAEIISGYTREQVVGNSSVWRWLYPDAAYRKEIRNSVNEVLDQGKSMEDIEQTIVNSKGEERVISWNCRQLVDKRGVTVGSVALGRDVTESIQAREQLLQAQKMDAIGQLAGGIAHELNNEMSIIQGYVEINLGRVEETSPVHKALLRIKSAAERSAHLTHQLLLSSRRQPQNKEPMNLNRNIRELQEMMEWFGGSEIKVKLDLNPELWRVNGDTVNIDQVITNLVLNARDAMPSGGVLSIKTENVYSEAGGHRDDALNGPFVCLTVSDTGTGMDSNVKAHLFEPFFTTKEHGKGNGLGLSVAYGIIEAHGGFIEVKSEIGRGSTFKCYLPAMK